jgi:uncharacterized glyoxalase superfamily protein PhnB
LVADMADFVKNSRRGVRSVAGMTPEPPHRSSTRTQPPVLNAFGLVVVDMAASLAFYRRLGLSIPETADGEPHVEVALAGGVRLMLDTVDTVRSFDVHWQPATGGHRMSLAFACASPSEVDKVHTDLVGAGYTSHLVPFDAPWGQRYASVLDPDGNPVELFAALG